ncbi:hypothetical protein V6N13_077580 [Hibiscus sabdariffa]
MKEWNFDSISLDHDAWMLSLSFFRCPKTCFYVWNDLLAVGDRWECFGAVGMLLTANSALLVHRVPVRTTRCYSYRYDRLLVSVRTYIHMTVGGFENMSYRYAKRHIGTARLIPVRLPLYQYAFWFLEFPIA